MATKREALGVGARIRAARDRAGLTQRALAQLLDTDSMLISKWERGVVTPRESSVVAVAQVLGIRSTELLDEEAA